MLAAAGVGPAGGVPPLPPPGDEAVSPCPIAVAGRELGTWTAAYPGPAGRGNGAEKKNFDGRFPPPSPEGGCTGATDLDSTLFAFPRLTFRSAPF